MISCEPYFVLNVNFRTLIIWNDIPNYSKMSVVQITFSRKCLYITLIAIALITCVDPYYPQLKGYESLLVIDGLITDEDAAYVVRLSRTKQDKNDSLVTVSDATVYITDNESNTTFLKSCGSGVYKTDSLEFKGSAGRTYILHILTSDGEEYESDPCYMNSVQGIDSIYYKQFEDIGTNWSEGNKGILISLNSENGDENQFYRWSYEETWKFRIPTPVKYVYVNESNIYEIPLADEYCWKNQKSEDILVHAVYPGQSTRIKEEPIKFIATGKSDRMTILYSILVKQFSISQKEYTFWSDLQLVNNSGGDIFESQPFSVAGNIHNINNPEDHVLGYFQVSSVTQKRIFISPTDIAGMNLPGFNYPCEVTAKKPSDYPYPFRTTFDEIYQMFCEWHHEYKFIWPIYFDGGFNLNRLAFTTNECADCRITGTLKKPDFWIDEK